ncbi:MAG: oligosaccharide flippase family protein [Patescibacteria group bacterium]
MGRILSPAEYGTLGALLSIYIIISTPLSAVQTTAAKLFAQYQTQTEKIKQIYAQLNKYLALISLVSFILFFIFLLFAFNFFNLESRVGLIILAFSLLFMFKLSWNRGVMQGLLNFTDLSVSFAFEGLIKLVVGVGLGVLFLRADYTVFSITFSLLIAYLLSLSYVKKIHALAPPTISTVDINYRELLIEALRMIIGMLGVMFFVSIDVIMAKKYLSADAAGLYTALSTLGKIVFFAPTSIAQVMFPYTSREKNKITRLALMKNALLMVIGIVGVITLVYFIFPQPIFNLLFGSKYAGINNLLGIIGIAIGVVSIVQLIINYLLSQPGWQFAWALFVAVIFQSTAYTIWHADVGQMVLVTLASSVVYLFTTSLALYNTENI